MRNRRTTNRKLWVVPHIKIQNANITSSPLVYGFPSMTAFTGLMDVLTRDLNRSDVHLDEVGVIVHSFESNTNNHKIKRFYPVKHPGNKKGEPSPIIEEGRGHFEISLVFNVTTNEQLNEEDDAQWSTRLMDLLRPRRVAGGTIVDMNSAYLIYLSDAQGSDDDVADAQFQKLMYSLMPGYVLVQRHDQMNHEDPIDSILDVCRLRSKCVLDDEGIIS